MSVPPSSPVAPLRPRWQRVLWLAAGCFSLLVGLIGIVVPLLPTTPLVLLSAWCFSQGSARWEAWMLDHPRFGPIVRNWRDTRAVPLRAKQLATVMMAISSFGTWWLVPSPWRWAPGVCCLAVAIWLWRLPTAQVPAAAPPR